MSHAYRISGALLRATIFIAVVCPCANRTLSAQEHGGEIARWHIGVFGGAVHNHLDAPMQRFIDIRSDPSFETRDYAKSLGVAPYAGLFGEYLLDRRFGVALRLAYDDRTVTKDVDGSALAAHLSYLSIEPALRVEIAGGFHFTGGPALGLIIGHRYDYTAADGTTVEDAELSNVHGVSAGAWGGFAYDIVLNDGSDDLQWFLTPFIDLSWLFDQKEIDVAQGGFGEHWTTGTGRVGIELKLGPASSIGNAPAIER